MGFARFCDESSIVPPFFFSLAERSHSRDHEISTLFIVEFSDAALKYLFN